MGRTDLPDPARDEDIHAKPRRHTNELSARHVEVLFWMADGRTNQEIADRLHLSIYTVMCHTKTIMQRLDASTRAHAVAIGFRRELIS